MSYTYIFEPGALTEYKEAVEWYMERSETAAENLITEIKNRIEREAFNFKAIFIKIKAL